MAAGSDALPASWWINFGAYAVPMATNMWASSHPYIVGFTGFGTLGGGNLSIAAGGDAGIAAARGLGDYGAPEPRSRALVAAVGGTGRVAPDGSLVLTGGGDLRLRLGGALNPDLDASQYATQYRTNRQKPDLDGMVTNLRGAIQIEARAIGGSRQLFRRDAVAQPGLTGDAMDPRPINPFVPTLSSASGGITLVPGDSAVYLETLGDLVLSGVSDAGRVRVLNTSIQTPGNGLSVGGGQSWFSLWTPATAINLLSAGGNVTPDTSLSHEAAGSAAVIRGRRDRVSIDPARDGGLRQYLLRPFRQERFARQHARRRPAAGALGQRRAELPGAAVHLWRRHAGQHVRFGHAAAHAVHAGLCRL